MIFSKALFVLCSPGTSMVLLRCIPYHQPLPRPFSPLSTQCYTQLHPPLSPPMYDPRHDTPSAYMGIVADFLRHEWQQEGLDAGEVWQEEYMASNQVSIYQGKK
uniref:Uncharacterized protein n=1 Tax=Guillardia theta TaxID=55529 RepID=A0A7S4PC07_GUITH